MKYAYREGYGYSGLDADRLGEILAGIAMENDGEVSTSVFKEAARNKKHPCNPYVFDKEPGEAAEAYYDQQAMKMCRSIYVIIEDRPDLKVPAWFNITGPPEGDLGERVLNRGYRSIGEVMGSEQYRQEAFRRVWSRILQLRRLYEHMTELAPIWSAVKQVEGKIDKKKAARK